MVGTIAYGKRGNKKNEEKVARRGRNRTQYEKEEKNWEKLEKDSRMSGEKKPLFTFDKYTCRGNFCSSGKKGTTLSQSKNGGGGTK